MFIILSLTIPVLILLLSYIYLAAYHRNLFLFDTIVHENGRLTLTQTIFYFDHYIGQLLMMLFYSFILAGTFAYYSAPRKTSRPFVEIRKAYLLFLALALLLIFICLIGSVERVGTSLTKTMFLQGKENDLIYTPGGNWKMMFPSNLLLILFTTSLFGILRDHFLLGEGQTTRNKSGLTLILLGTMIFLGLSIAFSAGPSTFLNSRWLAHSVREMMTIPFMSAMPTFGFLFYLESRFTAPRRMKVKPVQKRAEYALLFAAILLFAYHFAFLTSTDIVADVAQRPSFSRGGKLTITYLLTSHYFEHTLDYMTIALLSSALYLSVLLSEARRSN